MDLHIIDISIIAVYLVSTILIGFWVSKKASKDINSYFLGGNTIPWYILGVSNASGMFDITGTMWLVYLLFVYGMKGVFVPWLWPVFNQIFLMIYLSVWLRRSNVMTGAEWIKTRFGENKGATLSHIIIVVYALVSVIGFLAYGFKGIGKFSSSFLPWDLTPNQYALIFMAITTFYVIKGGMYSVVITELIQFVIMTIASVAIGLIAFYKVEPALIDGTIPEGWRDLFFGWTLDIDWTGILDSVNAKIASDGYEMFGFFMIMVLFKGIFVSMAGPAPNYDMQRILATKSPKESAKMSGMVTVALFLPRYMMIGGLTILALMFFTPELKAMGDGIDFEMILPMAIKNFVPIGLMGVLLAGLIAAFMSTFAATVNAAPAYLVNDIYKRFINKDAEPKVYVRMSYIISFVVVIVGISFGFAAKSIDSVTQWIVSALWGGYTASNILKWYWWRLNGYGYFWGMVAGILGSLMLPVWFPELAPLHAFPFIFLISLAGCIAGSYLSKPDNMEVLKSFYSKVRPWGFWGPVRDAVLADNPDFKPNKDFKRDMFNVAVGIIWQTSFVVIPVYLILHDYLTMLNGIIVLVISSLILKKNWWDKLEE